jgi:hypothetical protein
MLHTDGATSRFAGVRVAPTVDGRLALSAEDGICGYRCMHEHNFHGCSSVQAGAEPDLVPQSTAEQSLSGIYPDLITQGDNAALPMPSLE